MGLRLFTSRIILKLLLLWIILLVVKIVNEIGFALDTSISNLAYFFRIEPLPRLTVHIGVEG